MIYDATQGHRGNGTVNHSTRGFVSFIASRDDRQGGGKNAKSVIISVLR